jgi:Ca2+-dependent lipid-binding protein
MGCGGSKATKTSKEEVKVNEPEAGKTLLAAESTKKADEVEAAVKEGPPAVVKVSIVSAKGLRNADCALAGKSDPYCICEVTGKSDTKIETAVVPDKLNPEWNFEGEINGFRLNNSLTFTIKDKDPVKPDDILGKATLTTEQFLANGFDAELPLVETGDGIKAVLAVKVAVVHPKVRVTVFSARDLRNSDWIGKSDPYCTCEVVGKADTKFETAAIAESLNPRWDHEGEVVGYQVGDSITLTVKDKDPLKPDDILGKATLPCDSFLESGFSGDLQLSETSTATPSFLNVTVEVGEKKQEPSAAEQEKVDEPATADTVEQRDVTNAEDAPVVESQMQPTSAWCC